MTDYRLAFDLDSESFSPPAQRFLARPEIDIDAVRSLDGGARVLYDSFTVAWDGHSCAVGVVPDVGSNGAFLRLGAT